MQSTIEYLSTLESLLVNHVSGTINTQRGQDGKCASEIKHQTTPDPFRTRWVMRVHLASNCTWTDGIWDKTSLTTSSWDQWNFHRIFVEFISTNFQLNYFHWMWAKDGEDRPIDPGQMCCHGAKQIQTQQRTGDRLGNLILTGDAEPHQVTHLPWKFC